MPLQCPFNWTAPTQSGGENRASVFLTLAETAENRPSHLYFWVPVAQIRQTFMSKAVSS